MFDKFGEFGSAEEINACAAGLRDEGDEESLYDMAEENGIDREDVEDYLDGCMDELCSPVMAAIGKLKVEACELKPRQIMADWVDYIRTQCIKDERVARAVRKKGKSVKGCIGAVLKEAFAHQMQIDKEILKAAGVNAGKVTLGIPGMARANEIIKSYYLEETHHEKRN